MKIAVSAIVLVLVALLSGCGQAGELQPSPGSQAQQIASPPPTSPAEPVSTAEGVTPLEEELKAALAGAKERVQLGLTWAWAPAPTDERRFPYFKQHNESRWNLELDSSKIPAGTVYEQTTPTEEGGSVSEYLFFDSGQITWWYDGRGDAFSEFRDPAVRTMKVTRLFLAVHDGQSGWPPLDKREKMPLDHGLSVGIQLEDGSQRYW